MRFRLLACQRDMLAGGGVYGSDMLAGGSGTSVGEGVYIAQRRSTGVVVALVRLGGRRASAGQGLAHARRHGDMKREGRSGGRETKGETDRERESERKRESNYE